VLQRQEHANASNANKNCCIISGWTYFTDGDTVLQKLQVGVNQLFRKSNMPETEASRFQCDLNSSAGYFVYNNIDKQHAC